MRPLAYGLQNVIPETAKAAWGCRAILNAGCVDIVHDRKDMEIPDESAVEFKAWLRDVMSDHGWVDVVAKRMKGNRDDVESLDRSNFHVRMSTNSSYGYLYISAWME